DLCDRGLPHKSGDIGEWIGKDARTRLAFLCLRGIESELCDKPLPHKSRGRQKSAPTLLSEKLGVNRRTVYRWLEGGGVKACDVNAGRLAEIAYDFDPIETRNVLLEDLENYSSLLSGWLVDGFRGNCEASPCHTNQDRG
ncbi:MAG: hypothetical protein NTV61_10590, partial [Candidatus Bathyarchaeota archaeon]|nr:hypothetical protein [Candidatus Bathyarchaeota archaeon]